VYAKAAEYSCLFVTNIPNGRIYFDLNNGTVSALTTGWASASATPVGNGWYRCSVTSNVSQNGGNWYVGAFPSYATRAVAYAGNGFNGIYAWGAQLEAGNFPTSYIATVATTQTRNLDSATMTGANFSSWYDFGQGTFYGEGYAPPGRDVSTNSNHLFSVYDAGLGNRIRVTRNADPKALIFEERSNGAVNVSIDSGVLADRALIRVAFALKTNDFAAARNGTISGTDTDGLMPVSPTAFQIGGQASANNTQWNNTISKIAYWPERLPNAQLQTLTKS
jgi:hypothetical protein